MNVREYPLQ